MKFFPSMAVFMSIGDGIEIRWYAVCILVGALLTFYLASKKLTKAGYDSDIMDDLFMGSMFFGIAGARLWYCVFADLEGYLSNLTSIFMLWDGGLAIYGGLIGGALFVLVYCAIRKISFFHIADYILPYVLLAQGIGSWGSYFNQETYGNVVESTYFEGVLSFLKKGMYISGDYRQPLFFYESVLCLVGFVLILLYRKYSSTHRGDGVFCYLSWYGLIRFWLETQRTDSLMVGGLRVAQVVSAGCLVIGLLGLMGLFRFLLYSKKPAIIFDFDGVLADSQEAVEKSYQVLIEKYNPELELTEEQKQDLHNLSLRENLHQLFPEGNVDELVESYRECSLQVYKEYVKPYEHTKEVIKWLKDCGYSVAIVANKKSSEIRLGLDLCGLNDDFDVVVGSEEVDIPQPDKQSIAKALEKLSAGLDCAIYVCGNDLAVETAKNSGVYSVSVAKEKSAANETIQDLIELKEILQKQHNWTNNLY